MNIWVQNMLRKVRPLWLVQKASMKKVCTISKRGSMLDTLIKNHSSKKGWDPPVRPSPTKREGIFSKVPRPTKRRLVLNNLFIENITNVIATGDVAPELLGYGIEITGVIVSPDYTTLNVYWQIPPRKCDSVTQLHAMLAAKAPHIRAELISRNILGKVPHIHFIQDVTNARIVAFEEALARADMGPEDEARSVPEQDFLKDLCSFKSSKEEKKKPKKEKETIVCDKSTNHDTEEPKAEPTENLKDIRPNIYRLDHNPLMNRIMQAKTKSSSQIKQNQTSENDDLFSRIPGVPLQSNVDRRELLRQFCIDRKVRMEKLKAQHTKAPEDNDVADLHSSSENYNIEDVDFDFEPDYYDEEQDISYSSADYSVNIEENGSQKMN